MATVIHAQPVNAAQVVLALGSDGCTVRNNDEDGTCEVSVNGFTAEQIDAALAGIVYDPDYLGGIE